MYNYNPRDILESSLVDIEKSEDITEEGVNSSLYSIFELTARQIMIPRADLQELSINLNSSFEQIIKKFGKDHHFLPVYRKSIDEILGVLYLNDCINKNTSNFHLQENIRNVLFVSPMMQLPIMMGEMLHKAVDMAFVVDEFGGIDGYVTQRQIFVALYNEMEDAHHDLGLNKYQVIMQENGAIIASGRTLLTVLQEKLTNFCTELEFDSDVHTIGGLLCERSSKVPCKGEVLMLPTNYEVEILQADSKKVSQVLIRRRNIVE